MANAQQIKTSELRYRRLFAAAQDGIRILNAETGAITNVNTYLMKMETMELGLCMFQTIHR